MTARGYANGMDRAQASTPSYASRSTGFASGRVTVGMPTRTAPAPARTSSSSRTTNRYTVTDAAPARERSASSRTSSFGRFATPVDYWAGSTAPDFDYWDRMSAEAAEAWEEVPSRRQSQTAGKNPRANAKTVRNSGAFAAAREKVSTGINGIADASAELVARANAAADTAATATKTLPASLVLAVSAAIIIACLAIICFIRIDWSSETVLVQVRSQELSQTIASTRDAGRVLEVQRSIASNASRIRSEAIFMGMMEPESTESLYLDPDTVTTDAEGNLSLSGSMARVVQYS